MEQWLMFITQIAVFLVIIGSTVLVWQVWQYLNSDEVLKLRWQWFGYPDAPPRRMLLTFSKQSPKLVARMNPMAFKVVKDYVYGYSVEQIATRDNSTKTRVRSLLWEAYKRTNI